MAPKPSLICRCRTCVFLYRQGFANTEYTQLPRVLFYFENTLVLSVCVHICGRECICFCVFLWMCICMWVCVCVCFAHSSTTCPKQSLTSGDHTSALALWIYFRSHGNCCCAVTAVCVAVYTCVCGCVWWRERERERDDRFDADVFTSWVQLFWCVLLCFPVFFKERLDIFKHIFPLDCVCLPMHQKAVPISWNNQRQDLMVVRTAQHFIRNNTSSFNLQ